MRKSIQLTINTPCSEDFNQFKKTDKGGFCKSCAKEVIDFTGMSSEEIKNYFATTKNNTCGRFNKSQLKTYKEPLPPIEQKKFNLFGAIGLTAIALFINTNTTAQNTNSIEQTAHKNLTKGNKANNTFSVKGTVYSKDDNFPLPGVSIVLKNSAIKGTETDFDGYFELNGMQKGDVVEIYSLGYATKSIVIIDDYKLTIQLEEDNLLLGDVILVGEVDTKEHYKAKRSLLQRIKSIF